MCIGNKDMDVCIIYIKIKILCNLQVAENSICNFHQNKWIPTYLYMYSIIRRLFDFHYVNYLTDTIIVYYNI